MCATNNSKKIRGGQVCQNVIFNIIQLDPRQTYFIILMEKMVLNLRVGSNLK